MKNLVVLRQPSNTDEARTALDLIGADFDVPSDHTDGRMQRLLDEPTADNSLLVVATAAGHICGAAFAIPSRSDGALLATIGVTKPYRGTGVGRRLVEHIEAACIERSITGIVLGGRPDARPFYQHLGYTGRSGTHKSLPGSVNARYGDPGERQRRLEELRNGRASRTTPS